MNPGMPTTTAHVAITAYSGAPYVDVTGDGNLGASANAPTYMVPATDTPHDENAKRSHLRLVRD